MAAMASQGQQGFTHNVCFRAWLPTPKKTLGGCRGQPKQTPKALPSATVDGILGQRLPLVLSHC